MIRVSVVFALADRQQVTSMELGDDSTVADALAHAAVEGWFADAAATVLKVGIWSRPCEVDTRLRDGDRVEIYRPLEVDPKEARRRRARVRPSPRSRNEP